MSQAILFVTPQRAASFGDRLNLIRIPEFVSKIRQTQKILERFQVLTPDLHVHFLSEENYFTSNVHAKNLLHQVCRMALMERYLKFHSWPQLMIIEKNLESSLRCVAGHIEFDEYLSQTAFVMAHSRFDFQSLRPLEMVSQNPPDRYQVLRCQKDSNGIVQFASTGYFDTELQPLIQRIQETQFLDQITVLGFDNPIVPIVDEEPRYSFLTSIEKDPLLNLYLRSNERLFAQTVH